MAKLTTQLLIRCNVDFLALIDEDRKALNLSRSAYVRQAVIHVALNKLLH